VGSSPTASPTMPETYTNKRKSLIKAWEDRGNVPCNNGGISRCRTRVHPRMERGRRFRTDWRGFGRFHPIHNRDRRPHRSRICGESGVGPTRLPGVRRYLPLVDYLAFDQALQRRPSGKVRGLREAYRGASPDFKTVDDIAHAFKHAVTEPPGNWLKSDDVVKHNGAFSRDFSSDSDRHRVTVQGHPEIDLLDTVKRALAFLRDQFQIGVKCATLRARL